MPTSPSLPIGGPALPAELVTELCARLGTALPGDLAGVASLYRAWCARVPFDPVAKAVAVRAGGAPPGADPVEVVERWLSTGLGSTCWGHVTALGALLAAADVPSAVGLDRLLRDDGVVDFHAFLVVDADGGPLALDPIHPSGEPLPLVAGTQGTHPSYRTGIEADGARLAHTFTQPDRHTDGPDRPDRSGRYAILSTCLDHADVAAFCAVSARFSGVTSNRFFHRRAEPDAFVSARPEGGTGALLVETWRASGVEQTRCEDPVAALEALGYHGDALVLVERAGFVRRRDGGCWAWCEQAPPADRYRAPSGR